MSIRNKHRWSGWPGAYCMDCGAEDALENAMALDWVEVAGEDGITWKHPLYEIYVIFLNTHCLANATAVEIENYKKEVAAFEAEAKKEGIKLW